MCMSYLFLEIDSKAQVIGTIPLGLHCRTDSKCEPGNGCELAPVPIKRSIRVAQEYHLLSVSVCYKKTHSFSQ